MPPVDFAHWTPRPPPPRRALEGRYARLEPLDPARHGDDLFAARLRVPAASRCGVSCARARSRTGTSSTAGCALGHPRDPLFYAVVMPGRARRGPARYMRIDAARRIEIGHILFGRGSQRTRAATEAVCLLARTAFDDLGYRRLEWKCNALNAPPGARPCGFGFTFEGVFRQHMVVKGESRDTAWFAILDREWPALREAFERWLDPANFDAAGRQRTRLATPRASGGGPGAI